MRRVPRQSYASNCSRFIAGRGATRHDRAPKQMTPPVIRRWHRSTYLLPVGAAALTALAGFALSFTVDVPLEYTVGIVLVVAIVFHGILTYRFEQFVARIHRQNRELCLQCGYNLHGLPAQHTCPECGTVYEIESVKAEWKAFFDADRRFVVR